MQTENSRALLPCDHASVDAVCPGVWRIALGTPSALTPVALRELPPARGALEAMASVAMPPLSECLSWGKTARGFVVRFPVGDAEEFYGLGLQLTSLAQRGCKKTLRVNSDPPADAGDSHAPVPFLCLFVWSDERFPDPAAFLTRMRERRMLVNCWEHAFVHPASTRKVVFPRIRRGIARRRRSWRTTGSPSKDPPTRWNCAGTETG